VNQQAVNLRRPISTSEDFAKAERARALNPNSIRAHAFGGEFLAICGKTEEGIRAASR
jgi:hypothetical protein